MVVNTVALIEDDQESRTSLAFALRHHGYGVVEIADGRFAIAEILGSRPDVILLDLMLPGVSGFDVCRELRRMQLKTPVIMLTARTEESAIVQGLELGANDYVTKPFGLAELLARIRVQLRPRPQLRGESAQVSFGPYTFETDGYRLTRKGRTVRLTSTESELLRVLALRPGEIVTREELKSVLGYSPETSTRTVDAHILNLRRKLRENGDRQDYLTPVWGKGYRFTP
jgi:DNA-binding response OmpR family regulator